MSAWFVSFQLDNDAKICQTCDYGFFPIHFAARYNSSEAMEMIILHGGVDGDGLLTTNILDLRQQGLEIIL